MQGQRRRRWVTPRSERHQDDSAALPPRCVARRWCPEEVRVWRIDDGQHCSARTGTEYATLPSLVSRDVTSSFARDSRYPQPPISQRGDRDDEAYLPLSTVLPPLLRAAKAVGMVPHVHIISETKHQQVPKNGRIEDFGNAVRFEAPVRCKGNQTAR